MNQLSPQPDEGARPGSDDPVEPKLSGGHWTPLRLELLGWFKRNAPSLAELYEGAVKLLLYDVRLPGWTRFVSHAVREIRNRLPNVISGVKGGKALSYKGRLDEIGKVWEKVGLPLDGSLPSLVMSQESVSPTEQGINLPLLVFRPI